MPGPGQALGRCSMLFPTHRMTPRAGGVLRGDLTLVLLVPDDDEEGDAGPEGVGGNGHLTQHACQLATHSPHHLLVGPLIAGLGAVGQDDEATDDENQHGLRVGA